MHTENFSPHHQSGFQDRFFNEIKTIALLGPKIWDLVLLEIKQKKCVNVLEIQ